MPKCSLAKLDQYFFRYSTDGETKAFAFQKADVATLVLNGYLNYYTELASVSKYRKGLLINEPLSFIAPTTIATRNRSRST